MANNNLPAHVAVIPDGNRRWARKNGILLWQGHAQGAVRFREAARALFKMGIPYFTFWGASEDNLLKRSIIERNALVALFIGALDDDSLRKELMDGRIRFQVIGRWDELLNNNLLKQKISDLEQMTCSFSNRLTILFGYDGRREMLEAVRGAVDADAFSSPELDYNDIKKRLWTHDLPPVDLVIRTGEEEAGWAHWSSGFMMWDTADAEFYFTQTLWPDLSVEKLSLILENYSKRARKRGA